MTRTIVWNKKAVERFYEIVDYLAENYSQKVATDFVDKVNDLIDKINQYPEIGQRSKKLKTVRSYKIDEYGKN